MKQEIKHIEIIKKFNSIFHYNRFNRIPSIAPLFSECLNSQYGDDLRLLTMFILNRYFETEFYKNDNNSAIRSIVKQPLNELGNESLAETIVSQGNRIVEEIIRSVDGAGDENFVQAMNSALNYHANLSQPNVQSGRTAIIIHGTGARKQNWWRKGGTFWSYLDSEGVPVTYDLNPFSWSGGIKHTDRYNAANALVAWANNKSCELDIYAHSHGGNVALLATRLGLKIRKLVLMGTPIRYEYTPDMNQIEKIYNVFSVYDPVQKYGTWPNKRGDGRTLSDSDKIINCLATEYKPNIAPDHSDLHEPDTWKNSEFLANILRA